MSLSNYSYYLRDYRLWMVVGLVSAAALARYGEAEARQIGIWVAAVLAALLLLAGLIWGVKRLLARRAAKRVEAMVQGEADKAVTNAQPAQRADVEALRRRMMDAVKQIKSSRMGMLKGNAALYELPWYVILGNPAAGKSTAILNSGLQFPFEDSRGNVIQGMGGTRNCDWYFTTNGIVLDTAGRYSVSVEDRMEWLTFLSLLKQNRPRAPINGVIIAASIAELSGSKPEFAIELAKNLRQRVQEITERLEVFAPVYVLFTKADLIAGFSEFFRNLDPSERDHVWGATLPADPMHNDALAAFDVHFDELAEGIKEMSLTHMAMQRGRDVSPGMLSLPLEFVGIKPALRTFIATLFEENPYQFKPVFRGFYFSSALQEGRSVHHASERVGRQFGLQQGSNEDEAPSGHTAFFLKNLFRKVIFVDRELVKQYSSPRQNRLRYGVFFAAVSALALSLGLWTWSTSTNDAYNALKTYLMLGNGKYAESAHLAQQLTLFWRTWLEANRGQMSREEMVRAAEKLMNFHVAQAALPGWPQVENKVTLVADTRQALSQVMKGQPAMERVFAQIKARAGARFGTVTVDSLVGEERNAQLINGSYAISGAFTRKAWEEYVRDAVKEAANTQLSSTDWVLGTTEKSDLSLAGSPEHVSRELVGLYKQEYAHEWGKFVQGLSIAEFSTFDEAVTRIGRLGDAANSPLRALLEAINRETVWDNPPALAVSAKAQKGISAWFQRTVLRKNPTAALASQPVGPTRIIGGEPYQQIT
ncbi:MAG: type VI secretion system membrane subunit TssM [Stenotrophomonas sp.]|uniref:type VI secretion system membrane subunit TssM n=1 Tax=Stenotrophomonas sp. TaxID=69392 RepID=UPI003D6D23F5